MALPKTASDYVQEISDLELRLDLKDSYISILEHHIKEFQSIKLSDGQEFLDKAAIAAMNGFIIAGHRNGLFKEVDDEKIAEWSFDAAIALMAEKKRLQDVDNGTN